MAITYIPFLPQANNSPPFQTQVTLDNVVYALACWWNLYRGDYYLSLTDQSGNVVYYGALVGSPLDSDIDLAPGIFQISTLLYRTDTGNFEVGP